MSQSNLINKNKRLALLTAMFNYIEIVKKEENLEVKEVKNLFNNLSKYEKKLKAKTKLNKADSNEAQKYFDKLKNIDANEFETKLFSATLMALLLFQWFLEEERDLEIRNKFLGVNIDQMVNELETSSIVKTVMEHHRVVTKMIEV